MTTEGTPAGRRSTDADLAALAEWREGVNTILVEIHTQTKETNGRVSELEVRERIRRDREEQAAIRSAAAEAAKWRVEQAAEQELLHVEQRHVTRITWKVMLAAAGLGALPASCLELGHLIFT